MSSVLKKIILVIITFFILGSSIYAAQIINTRRLENSKASAVVLDGENGQFATSDDLTIEGILRAGGEVFLNISNSSTNKVLSVDRQGKIILVDDQIGSGDITNNYYTTTSTQSIDSPFFVLQSDNGDKIGLGLTTPDAKFHIKTEHSGTIGLIVEAENGQTADLVQFRNQDGVDAVSITSDGKIILDNNAGHQLEVRPSGDTGYLSSSGGAVFIENTANKGTGLGIFSNAGSEALGNMINVKVDNPEFNQAAFYMNYDGISNAVEIVSNTEDSSSNALAVTNYNTSDSALGIIGYESGRGTIKVTHNKPSASDANASGLSIDLKGTGTAAQGIFVDSTATGGTTGDLLKLRNEGTQRFAVGYHGSLEIGGNGFDSSVTKYGNTVGDEFFVGTNGAFRVQRSVTDSEAFRTQINGDTQGRWLGTSDGKLKFGDGSSAQDVTLQRTGVGLFQLDTDIQIVSQATNNDVLLLTASDGSRLGRFTETSGGHGWFEVDDSSGTAQVLLRGDGGDSYFLTSNVGIGTSSPQAPLHINDSSNSQLLIENVLVPGRYLSLTYNTGTAFILGGTGDDLVLGTNGTGVVNINGDTADQHDLSINTDDLYVDYSSGNIGIGDTSPVANLVIGSDTGANYANGAGDVYIQNDLEIDGNLYVSGTASTAGFWSQTDNTIYPTEYWTDELLIGGNATASADIRLGVDGTVVFNELGNDADFRIEGDTAQNLFVIDASADKIGLTLADASHLDNWDDPVLIDGNVNLDGRLNFVNSAWGHKPFSGLQLDTTNSDLEFWVSTQRVAEFSATGADTSAPVFDINGLRNPSSGSSDAIVQRISNGIQDQGTYTGTHVLLDINPTITTVNNDLIGIRIQNAYTGIAQTNSTAINYFSGFLGIGNTSPVAKLDLSGAVTGKALAIFDETGDQNIFTASASGTTRFVIQNDGNVGIGTSGPSSDLDIESTTGTDLLELTNSTSGLSFSFDVGSNGMTVGGSGGAAFQIVDTAPGSTLTVSNGQVTIGASTALIGNGASADLTLKSNTTGADAKSVLIQGYNGSAWQTVLQAPNKTSGNIDLELVTNGGNVGINDTTPDHKLDIEGYYAGNALVSLNETGGNDIFTASASGTAKFTIDNSGNVGIGTTAFDGTAASVLTFGNGTAPGASITDGVQLWAEDVTASSELRVRDEAGNVSTLSPHNFSLIEEGPSEDMAWAYYSEKDSLAINADITKALRILEQISGTKLVHIKNLETGEEIDENYLSDDYLSDLPTDDTQLASSISGILNIAVNKQEFEEHVSWLDSAWQFLTDITFKAKAIFEDSVVFLADATFAGHLSVSADTARDMHLSAGTKKIKVNFEKEYNSPPIVYASSDSDVLFKIENITRQSFEVNFENNLTEDINFKWFALEKNSDSSNYEILESSN